MKKNYFVRYHDGEYREEMEIRACSVKAEFDPKGRLVVTADYTIIRVRADQSFGVTVTTE